MDDPKELLNAAAFFASEEGVSLQEKLIELVQKWVDDWEARLGQERVGDKTKAKIISIRRNIHQFDEVEHGLNPFPEEEPYR